MSEKLCECRYPQDQFNGTGNCVLCNNRISLSMKLEMKIPNINPFMGSEFVLVERPDLLTAEEFASHHPTGMNDCYASLVTTYNENYPYLYKAMEEYAKYYHEILKKDE